MNDLATMLNSISIIILSVALLISNYKKNNEKRRY